MITCLRLSTIRSWGRKIICSLFVSPIPVLVTFRGRNVLFCCRKQCILPSICRERTFCAGSLEAFSMSQYDLLSVYDVTNWLVIIFGTSNGCRKFVPRGYSSQCVERTTILHLDTRWRISGVRPTFLCSCYEDKYVSFKVIFWVNFGFRNFLTVSLKVIIFKIDNCRICAFDGDESLAMSSTLRSFVCLVSLNGAQFAARYYIRNAQFYGNTTELWKRKTN